MVIMSKKNTVKPLHLRAFADADALAYAQLKSFRAAVQDCRGRPLRLRAMAAAGELATAQTQGLRQAIKRSLTSK